MKRIFASLAAALLGAALFAQTFTIAVISDTQNYSDYRYQRTSNPPFVMDQADIFHRQMDYIAKNAVSAGGPIAFAVHVGDIVQNYAKQPSEWAIAEAALSRLDGVLPYGLVPGNHDYDKNWTDTADKASRVDGGDTYNRFFGPDSAHFKGKSWYGGSFNGGLDSWSTFQAGGKTFMFLGLELEPSSAAIAWAQKVLDAHKDLPTILVTHEYLCYADDYYAPGTAFRLEDKYRLGFDRNTPQQLWDKLIYKNKQVFLVLCGHNYDGGPNGENARTDADADGYKVYQMVTDYQGRTEIQRLYGVNDSANRGGDGWMRFLEFDLGKGEIHAKTYSTEFRRNETDPDSDFTIKFDWDWSKRFGK